MLQPYPVDGSPLLPVTYIAEGVVFLVAALLVIYVFVHHKHKHFKNRLKSFLRYTLVFAVTLFAIAGLIGGYILLPAPKISNVSPSANETDFNPQGNITITFTKPVSRISMQKSIDPDTPGVWIFEDPIYATHLYRKLVFYPDIGLKPDTNYTVNLTGIQNTLQKSRPYDYELTFKTQSLPVVAQALAAVENQTFKLNVPRYLQQHTLSCEVSALRMTLAYKGINKSEDELLNLVGFDPTPHTPGVWGNPHERFVGNVNGNQMRDGYGVYWGPIERVAKMFGNATAFERGNVAMLTSEIKKGNPVIIWVYSKNGTPTSWTTPDGVKIFAAAGEHTVVAVGYVGPADNPTKIIVNDPLIGQVYWSRSLFDRKWATFSQSGVIIYK